MNSQTLWDQSFAAQKQDRSYNTVPPEAIVRTVSYHLRSLEPNQRENLRYLDMGCGAGATMVWLAECHIHTVGIDISQNALKLSRTAFYNAGWEAGSRFWPTLYSGSVTSIPEPDGSFDGILEANVFQHLGKEDREKAFSEVRRLLKPGGIFVGYDMAKKSTPYYTALFSKEGVEGDPGAFLLGNGKGYHVENIGLTYFFIREEYEEYLKGFSVIDPCLIEYEIPATEAERRSGYFQPYRHRFYCTFAIK